MKVAIAKTMAVFTVMWHDRKEIMQRIKDNMTRIQPVVLLFLLVALFVTVTARVKMDNERIKAEEAAQTMRLDLEKQEAIRASMIASEQAKINEAKAAHTADCEAVARVLYGTALHHSEDAQKAVVWCILNRVDSSLYPNTISEVCEQPSQWMGYGEENPIISGLYDIADEVITAWQSGEYRPMSPDYLFLSWTADEIILRTTFNEGRNTHYWRAG